MGNEPVKNAPKPPDSPSKTPDRAAAEKTSAEEKPVAHKKLSLDPLAKKGTARPKLDMIVPKPAPAKPKPAPPAAGLQRDQGKGIGAGEPSAPSPAVTPPPVETPAEPDDQSADDDGAVVMSKPERQAPVAIIVAIIIALVLLVIGYIGYTTSQSESTTDNGQSNSTGTDLSRNEPVGQTDVDEEINNIDGLLQDLDGLGELEDGLDDSSLGL